MAAHPERDLSIKYNSLNNNQLEGIVYLDAMLDEDYYGQGICHWKLVSITVQFIASDDPDDTKFIVNVTPNELKKSHNSVSLSI